MKGLSYKALPYLDYDLEKLYEIEKIQQELFLFQEEYMSPDAYHEKIASRKAKFMMQWHKKNLKSWNFAEWNAYKKMLSIS